jgi:hypothetical protein
MPRMPCCRSEQVMSGSDLPRPDPAPYPSLHKFKANLRLEVIFDEIRFKKICMNKKSYSTWIFNTGTVIFVTLAQKLV